MNHKYEIEYNGINQNVYVLKHTTTSSYIVFEKHLDVIDLRRMKDIIIEAENNNEKGELWHILSKRTLPNGLNALSYFHSSYMNEITPALSLLDRTPSTGNTNDDWDTIYVEDKLTPEEIYDKIMKGFK